jgi:hypothetical protein
MARSIEGRGCVRTLGVRQLSDLDPEKARFSLMP